MQRQHGITLVELMIVLVIIAGLAALAYPSYTKQVQRTKRAECAGGLVALQGAMERYFTTNNTYTGATAANTLGTITCPIDGGTPTYGLSVTVGGGGATYTLTAVPDGAQASDSCGTLSLTNTGVKSATGGTLQECWR